VPTRIDRCYVDFFLRVNGPDEDDLTLDGGAEAKARHAQKPTTMTVRIRANRIARIQRS